MSLTVLHAIPSFVGGGAERQLSLLAPELCRLGVNTHVAYLHHGVHVGPLVDSPVRLHKLKQAGNHDPRILHGLLRLIRDIQPNLIQTWLPQMDIFGGLASSLSGLPFVLSERSSEMAYRSGWKNRLRKIVGRRAAAIVANSQGGLDYWKLEVRNRQIVRNGIPVGMVAAATSIDPSVVGLESDTRLILFAGRLDAEKNISNLLAAIESVIEANANCAAVLFGEGALRPVIQDQIRKMRMAHRVRLEGYTNDLWRWMRRASVFVSVSRFEGSPNALLEAMVIGCPLVVSAIPQHREILDEKMALFCDPESVTQIAETINAVLADRDASTSRAALAAKRVQAWSVELAALSYLKLYKEIIQLERYQSP